jgi:hypothetical protein
MMKFPYVRSGFAALMAAGVAACVGERATEGDATPGQGRVVSREPSWKEGEGWVLSATPRLVIGTEAADSMPLYGVVGAVRLVDGRIVVADRGAAGLRFYDPSGRHLLTSGGKGSGPGEFRGVDALARIRGDTLLVWDRVAGRLSVVSPAGTFAGSHQPRGLNVLPWFAGAFGDGSYAVSAGTDPAQMLIQPGSTRQDTLVILHLGRGGELLDTIGRFPGPETFVDVTEGGVTMERIIFGESSSMAVAADRFFAGTTSRYELMAYTPTHGSVMTIEKRETRRQASARDVKAYRESLLNRSLGDVPAEVRARTAQRVAAIPHRPNVPMFGEIKADGLGYLWVSESALPGQAAKWDIFAPNGIWMGTLSLPAGLAVHDIGEDYVLGLARDELGVERVELYSLDRRP